jgi:hypothetical protein
MMLKYHPVRQQSAHKDPNRPIVWGYRHEWRQTISSHKVDHYLINIYNRSQLRVHLGTRIFESIRNLEE